MRVRKVGTVLLEAGFVAVVVAALIRDPVAQDANIGAGVLLLVGIPLGTFGLAMTAGGAAYETWSRRAAVGTGTRRTRGDAVS